MLLFGSRRDDEPRNIGRISFEGDLKGVSAPTFETVSDDFQKVDLTDKAWAAYEKWLVGGCKGILWEEPMPGLVCCQNSRLFGIAESVRMAAPRKIPVIILGETGTGKEVVAKVLHKWSRRPGPFKSVNCGGLTPEDVKSELSGHKIGAYTGANYERKGAFLEANCGTLFLDEIGEMPLSVQPQLLRRWSQVESSDSVPTAADRDP